MFLISLFQNGCSLKRRTFSLRHEIMYVPTLYNYKLCSRPYIIQIQAVPVALPGWKLDLIKWPTFNTNCHGDREYIRDNKLQMGQ